MIRVKRDISKTILKSPYLKFGSIAMKKISFFILLSLLIVADAAAQLGRTASEKSRYIKNIAEIKKGSTAQDIFKTEGYIVKTHKCPPSGKIRCKPCFGDTITISETITKSRSINRRANKLVAFTEEIDKFSSGRKYMFTLKRLGARSADPSGINLTLIGFQEIK